MWHCRIRVVSPILGDALINSRWWRSSHRRSLHSIGDHPQRATSSVLPDRGDGSGADCKKTSTQYASFNSSSFWRLLAASNCRRVVDAKPRQNKTFDPSGSRGHLRACPFLGSWRALVCGEVLRARAAGDELQRFFSEEIRWLF